jgi:NAD(P)-dependent dehydrogenase (short-subunit alcohol dehydrogenase family)
VGADVRAAAELEAPGLDDGELHASAGGRGEVEVRLRRADVDPARPASQFAAIVYGASKAAVSMLTVQYARAVPEVKINAVEPGYTATELGDVDHSTGQPVEVGAAVIARWASIGADGPTATFQEEAGVLGW